ncbi:ABC transporter ATP-binding protein [Microbacterium sp. GXF6406]
MPHGQLIEFAHVTKRFGAVAAVSDFSARVNPGVVTGFLGPNGAGKTTTLRMLLGLERPTSGTASIGGTRVSDLRNPGRVIGAMLEDPGFRPRRTVERHLTAAAKANGVPVRRVSELISFVGLGSDADTRIAALSLGMRQRLSAATALLGDPGVLVLDEPANGLDPEGIRWMRTLIRGLADEGRTVLVSSHVLSEVEQIADEILVIAQGRLKFAGSMEDLADPRTGPVVVDANDRRGLSRILRGAGYQLEVLRSGLTVRGGDAESIGNLAAHAGIALSTLQQRGPTLEDVFLDLVHDRYVRPTAAPATAAVPIIAEHDDPVALSEQNVAAPRPAFPVQDAPTPGPVEEEATVLAPVEDIVEERVAPAVEEPVAPVVDKPVAPVATETTAPVPATAEETVEEASPADQEPTERDATEASAAAELFASTPIAAALVEERPLPGLAGLAAMASVFNATPVAENAELPVADAESETEPAPTAEESTQPVEAETTSTVEEAAGDTAVSDESSAEAEPAAAEPTAADEGVPAEDTVVADAPAVSAVEAPAPDASVTEPSADETSAPAPVEQDAPAEATVPGTESNEVPAGAEAAAEEAPAGADAAPVAAPAGPLIDAPVLGEFPSFAPVPTFDEQFRTAETPAEATPPAEASPALSADDEPLDVADLFSVVPDIVTAPIPAADPASETTEPTAENAPESLTDAEPSAVDAFFNAFAADADENADGTSSSDDEQR